MVAYLLCCSSVPTNRFQQGTPPLSIPPYTTFEHSSFEDRALRKALRYLRRRLHDNAAMMDGIRATSTSGNHDPRIP